MAKRKGSTNQDKPNGPVAGALLAAGFGSAVLGLMTVLNEASPAISQALNWNNAVGPLSGKVGIGMIAFFLSWIVLHFALRGKNVNFPRAAAIAYILLAIGVLLTFPPIFDLFAAG
jgi:hypothetical protein